MAYAEDKSHAGEHPQSAGTQMIKGTQQRNVSKLPPYVKTGRGDIVHSEDKTTRGSTGRSRAHGC